MANSNYLPDGEVASYLDFYLCGPENKTLCLKKESEDPIALTSERIEITNLGFIYVASSSVEISFDVNYKNPNNRPEYQASINLKSIGSIRLY